MSRLSNVSVITSLDDHRIDPFRNVRDADLRGRKHLFMVETEMVVRRLLSTEWNIQSILVSPQKHERLAAILHDRNVPVYVADITLMSKIAGFPIHRGVLAAVHRPSHESGKVQKLVEHLRNRTKVSLLLAEGITNVDNMGSLFRNAAAFGVDAVILDQSCCDPLYRKALRVSMGHALSVPWIVAEDWNEILRLLKTELSVMLIGCETGERAIPIWEVQCKSSFGLVLGEEKSGLSSLTISLCDVIAEIPMNPRVPSINVAVASAVGLYEFLRRNSFNNR